MFHLFSSILGALKLVLGILKNDQVFSRCSTPCMFSEIISSSVVKCYEKYKNNQKWQYSVLYVHFRNLKLVLKVLKKHQIFMKHSTSCIFSKEKKLKWHCFIFNSENILENAKSFLKYFGLFSSFLGALKLVLKFAAGISPHTYFLKRNMRW